MRQSRASRAGGALQFHTARVLSDNGIPFQAQAVTENGERPDFLFPSAAAYHNSAFPDDRLRMLAVKFTLKERWRQVLNEAARIRPKHLLTMDAAITEPSLNAMRVSDVVVVVPAEIRRTYRAPMQSKLLCVRELLNELTPKA